MSFKEISADSIKDSAIKMLRDEWMLVSVGDEEQHNMMTASWGFIGEMWGKDCAIAAIRPTRHTYSIIENRDTFSLCFMGDNREVHSICGSKSGRDIDKVKATGLTPIYENNTMYFNEARVVIICKKLYTTELKPEQFTDTAICEKWYNNDFHKLYFGEIIKVLEK